MVSSIFWTLAGLLLWTHVLYGIVVKLISIIRPRPWSLRPYKGCFSFITAAYNEEEVIADKIQNCLALDFGEAHGELLLVSDGSTDGTNSILSAHEHASSYLRILRYSPRAGKAHALNMAVSKAKGDVLIFSDANVMIAPDGLRTILEPFTDPHVGAVCGRVAVRGKGEKEISGESLYMKLEGMIQRAEALVYSMVGTDGAFYALRKNLYTPLPTNLILDDFALAMEAPLHKSRIVYADNAHGIEEVISSAAGEFRRKTRIVAGGYQYLSFGAKRLIKLGPWMAFAFLSHKILRWLGPFFMLGVFITNIFLLNSSFYAVMFVLQILFYLFAVCAVLIPALRKLHMVYLPYYFCAINAASFCGLLRYCSGRHSILWDRSPR
ncbi:MAG: glycosyltransferase [Chitinivibrionales bacterium]|nr:glycosyltransferase [Chitinivibrionales bacterium]MBD3358236.1 glycosyltransferase [Chitinivibrionales bacterium]